MNNLLSELKNHLKHCLVDGKFYLVKKLSEMAGFFMTDKKLVYVVKNFEGCNYNQMKSEYLSLCTNVEVHAVENSPQFETGFYNLLEYKIPSEENIDDFEAFVNLCVAHIQYMGSKDFLGFFYSLMNLFQPQKYEKRKNIIGLYGELLFIDYVYTNYDIDISKNWHATSGSYSKYDFDFNGVNFEVKTTFNISNVLLKHFQIFNSDKNYLIVMLIEENNVGKSLEELINELYLKGCCRSYKFTLNLETEKKRVSAIDVKQKKFVLKNVFVYDTNAINVFHNIPESITDLQYRIDLSEKTCLSDKQVESTISAIIE